MNENLCHKSLITVFQIGVLKYTPSKVFMLFKNDLHGYVVNLSVIIFRCLLLIGVLVCNRKHRPIMYGTKYHHRQKSNLIMLVIMINYCWSR